MTVKGKKISAKSHVNGTDMMTILRLSARECLQSALQRKLSNMFSIGKTSRSFDAMFNISVKNPVLAIQTVLMSLLNLYLKLASLTK